MDPDAGVQHFAGNEEKRVLEQELLPHKALCKQNIWTFFFQTQSPSGHFLQRMPQLYAAADTRSSGAGSCVSGAMSGGGLAGSTSNRPWPMAPCASCTASADSSTDSTDSADSAGGWWIAGGLQLPRFHIRSGYRSCDGLIHRIILLRFLSQEHMSAKLNLKNLFPHVPLALLGLGGPNLFKANVGTSACSGPGIWPSGVKTKPQTNALPSLISIQGYHFSKMLNQLYTSSANSKKAQIRI